MKRNEYDLSPKITDPKHKEKRKRRPAALNIRSSGTKIVNGDLHKKFGNCPSVETVSRTVCEIGFIR